MAHRPKKKKLSREQELLRCLYDLEKELHRSWQRLDGEAKYIRHLCTALLGVIGQVRHDLDPDEDVHDVR